MSTFHSAPSGFNAISFKRWQLRAGACSAQKGFAAVSATFSCCLIWVFSQKTPQERLHKKFRQTAQAIGVCRNKGSGKESMVSFSLLQRHRMFSSTEINFPGVFNKSQTEFPVSETRTGNCAKKWPSPRNPCPPHFTEQVKELFKRLRTGKFPEKQGREKWVTVVL